MSIQKRQIGAFNPTDPTDGLEAMQDSEREMTPKEYLKLKS